jgi:hypothetical protein
MLVLLALLLLALPLLLTLQKFVALEALGVQQVPFFNATFVTTNPLNNVSDSE